MKNLFLFSQNRKILTNNIFRSFLLFNLAFLVSCSSIPNERYEDKPKISEKNNLNYTSNYSFNFDENSISIIDENSKNSFFIQFPGKISVDKLENGNYEVRYARNFLILKNQVNTISFTIDDINYPQKTESLSTYTNNKIHSVIGISKINNISKNEIITKYQGKIPVDGDDGSSTMNCNSGGMGASQCAVQSGIGTINTGCEVTCNSGYFACCDDQNGICKCIKSKN